jgi:futalosine hydrolase
VRTLLVAATAFEVAPLTARLGDGTAMGPRLTRYTRGADQDDLLITGVGMVATAAWCARTLTSVACDRAFNLGVCGSFDENLPPGTVVHVTTDRIAELGAEDGDRFRTLSDLGLRDEASPGPDEVLTGAAPPGAVLAALPAVTGITVNTVHGHEPSIAAVLARFSPQVESMEGAAFMYACRIHNVPFAQIRAVSNRVERRNRAAWKLAEAIDALGRTALTLLDER